MARATAKANVSKQRTGSKSHWIAINDGGDVIATSKNLSTAIAKAKKSGVERPTMMKVPKGSGAFFF